MNDVNRAPQPKRMTANEIVSEEIIPLAMGMIFMIATIATIWLCASTTAVADSNSPEKEYQLAVYAAMSPSSDWVSSALFRFNQPTVFVTWTRSSRVPILQGKSSTDKHEADRDIWVTDAASLKKFCQDFVRLHQGDELALSLRLKQRLGLPPSAAYDSFVELLVDPAKPGGMFRPCGDPSAPLDGSTCALPKNFPRESDVWDEKPHTGRNAELEAWTLRKYYSSYASVNPYPWTELGYTFDWARAEDGSGKFVRRGQTEFVIPKGDPINFVSATPTVAYCAAE